MYQIQNLTKQSPAYESQMDDFSVIWEVRLDAQTLVSLLLELNSPYLPHRQLLLGWQRSIPPCENRRS